MYPISAHRPSTVNKTFKKTMKLSRNDTEETVYVARIGQHMLQIAARRALHAAHLSVAMFGKPFRANAALTSLGLYEYEPQPQSQAYEPICPPDGVPGSIQEFLRVLAEELEQADRDDEEH